jgi:putative nucleotidyltransferase with HDIG domain
MIRLDERSREHLEGIDHIRRPRLENRLNAAAPGQVSVLLGPPGAGKGAVLRAACRDANTSYYRVGRTRATFARFVHGLAQAVAPVAPGAFASFPRAWERALQSDSPSAVLARWLTQHLDANQHLAIDDLHDASGDPRIAEFIGALVDLRRDAALTLAAHVPGALPIALWMATERMERPIDEADLRFDRAEATMAAKQFGLALSDTEIEALLATTTGSPIAVIYALTQLRARPRARSLAAMPASFGEIAERIIARRTERERVFLFTAALFPTVDGDVLVQSGWDDADAIRAAIGADAAFMWEQGPPGGFSFHDRFRDFLARQFAARDSAFRAPVADRVVDALTRAGRYADALSVATAHGLTGAMGALLDTHGFTILESGEVGIITEALTAANEALATAADAKGSLGARALALSGYLEARAEHLDTAEAWFRLGLDKADDDDARVAIALYYARELALRRREDAFEVLAPFADSTTLPRSVLIDVRSSFAQALTAANRLDEATLRTEEAIALLEPGSPPALRAKVLARAAYVAMECDSIELARERALIAAPLAEAQCLYDVAASTYSVLYNIAYEIDDDVVACLHHLARMRDLGAKSGTLRLDLYVMLARYELFAETGDEVALADLERQLATIDKHNANREIAETLLPARAMQRLLRPTADHQATPARRALRWAQIGLYCAACGDAEQAQHAFAKSHEARAQAEARTTNVGLALLLLGLAALVGGDIERATSLMNAAADAGIETAPRLRAMRDVIAAMIAARHDRGRFVTQVGDALAALWTVSFGGMAKLIEALPLPFAHGADARGTIGTALAGQHGSMSRPAPAVVGIVDDIDASIASLFVHLDLAAPLMAEHSRAVSAWCSRIARVLGLPESQITFLSRCGLIHDIGKVRTPSEILAAPRALSSDEWTIMKEHAAEGGRIIAAMPQLRELVPIVRGHHERLDGKGYPDGLRSADIPLAARIVSVADSFNAMIGRRPYRLPLAPTDALEELQRNCGTQFDPEVVEALTRIVLGRLASSRA